MSNPLDPFNWGDYPTLAELALDQCQEPRCRECNQMPASQFCRWHTPADEQREIDVAAADDRGVDADWGSEGC